MTADVDVRSQDPSWIHGTPVAKQCAGIGEASDRRQQQDAGPASAPTKEAPSGSIEITIPTTHSQTFADETNNIAVEAPLTQPREDPSVPVPGSRRGKRIYYLALVQCDTWTQEDYNRRFIFVKNELQSTVNGDPDCRDRAPYVSYELRMVGTNRDQAVPSIVVNCRERDTRSLKSLFARADKKLGRGKGSLTDRLPWAKPHTILIPPLPLVYCGFKGGPVTQKMSDEYITAYFGNSSTYCGGLVQYQGASATLGLSLHIDGINAQLTVDHVFSSKRSVEPIAIPVLGNSPSDTPHTTPDNVDMDSLNGLWENDDDEYDYEDEAESGVEDETSDPTFPEVDTATMKPSEEWEKMIPPETLDPSLSYLDWVLARPLPRMWSPPPPIGFVNAFFPDGPGGRPAVISQTRDEPPVHLAPVYMISGVRGVLCGVILTSSTFLGSPAQQVDSEVWTVVLKSPEGLISGEFGSVVVDQKTHEVYGHVIGCNPWGHAFVVPLRHVLSQVKASFGATRVGLTGLWDSILGLRFRSQLHQVYRQDDLSFIQQVLATGEVGLNSRDDRGRMPLHRAAREGNEVLARLLLEHGAAMEAKAGGQTPLHYAAREGNEVVAGLLLVHGADLRANDYSGQTPLHYATREGNAVVAGLLLEHGADTETKAGGQTPLHYAAREGNEVVVRLLLEHGADKETKDYVGLTPLDYAVMGGHYPVVSLLLNHEMDKEAKGSGGKTPLHLAAKAGDGVIPSNVRAPDHLHRALWEIDGFLAGMRYLDETESFEASEPGDGPLELGGSSKATTLISQPAANMAWSSIRDLRRCIQYDWEDFMHISQKLDDPTIKNLYKAYKDARGFREAGVFAFRNTLPGLAPNDLRKFFAFCSFSYAISRLLNPKVRLRQTEFWAGVSLWLHALEIPGEQEAFKILARSLWPETRRHIGFSNQDRTIQGLGFPTIDSTAQKRRNFPDDTLQGQLAGPSHGRFSAPTLGDMPIVSPDVTEQRSSVPSAASIWMNNPGKLHDTKVFTAVVQYCHANGDFWYNLSDRGAISKDIRSLLAWNQECAQEKKLIHEQYLKHLLLEKDTKDVTSRGIVSVAEGFIDIGYLQSIDEAKNYMTKMASLIFTDERAHDSFIVWITDPKNPFPYSTYHHEFPRKHNMELRYEEVQNKRAKTKGARS
ncbi:hypothetical protein CEP51_007105 [Fusarium floridanum]|uniref:Uncharacterized protein n=1 Tax=Fusarium floridanum TaxID=1325733 RepID=A0A428RQB8_9HYPO|nr:hypothetical protein CEP51_007105 [Fusarium floridanum]